jgi:hypothetical protein
MQHSVNFIAQTHAELSDKRQDKLRFNADDFKAFAKENAKKYGIIDNGHDMLVSTWHSDDLIKDYKATIGAKKWQTEVTSTIVMPNGNTHTVEKAKLK